MSEGAQSGKVIVLVIPKKAAAEQAGANGIASQLKALRKRFRVPMRELAGSLGLAGSSSWQHYEDKFKGEFLPVDVARAIAPVFERHGVAPSQIWAMTGVPQPAPSNSLGAQSRPLLEEISDLRRQLDTIEARAKSIRKILG